MIIVYTVYGPLLCVLLGHLVVPCSFSLTGLVLSPSTAGERQRSSAQQSGIQRIEIGENRRSRRNESPAVTQTREREMGGRERNGEKKRRRKQFRQRMDLVVERRVESSQAKQQNSICTLQLREKWPGRRARVLITSVETRETRCRSLPDVYCILQLLYTMQYSPRRFASCSFFSQWLPAEERRRRRRGT